MKLTPLHIKLMIHCYLVSSPINNADAPAVIDHLDELLSYELIYSEPESGSGYKATDRGIAFVDKLCSTELPKQEWV